VSHKLYACSFKQFRELSNSLFPCHIPSLDNLGLLLFGEGEALGERGLRWLKVHLVNKFGAIRKASYDDKERYADQHMDQIMDSADNMCTGNCVQQLSNLDLTHSETQH